MPPQRQKHISQNVGTVLTLPPPAAPAADSGVDASHGVPAAAAPNVAAEICRKRLREMVFMSGAVLAREGLAGDVDCRLHSVRATTLVTSGACPGFHSAVRHPDVTE